MAIHHPSSLNEKIVRKVLAHRGRLHAYDTIEPTKTTLVVVDMTTASVQGDPNCLAIVEPINAVAAALRDSGGSVAWVVPAPLEYVPAGMIAVFGATRARYFREVSQVSDPRSSIFEGLQVLGDDLQFTKSGSSAFFPGNCDLHPMLAKAGIDTVLIAGTVTNVCCESSARDAVELGYKVTMISDANAGHAHGLHEATFEHVLPRLRRRPHGCGCGRIDRARVALKLAAFPKCYIDDIAVRRTMSVFDWIAMARDLPCEGLELYEGFLWQRDDDYLDSVSEALLSAGFVMPMLCCSPDFQGNRVKK